MSDILNNIFQLFVTENGEEVENYFQSQSPIPKPTIKPLGKYQDNYIYEAMVTPNEEWEW